MKKIIIPIAMFLSVLFMTETSFGEELTANLTLSNGGNPGNLTDDSHYTVAYFNEGDTVTISSDNNTPISGVYITWDSPSVPWTLTTDNGDISCGNNGFLHEYVKLDKVSKEIKINIPSNEMRISTIRIYGEGELPHDVQVWNPPFEKADILVVASHADDEILFFGGILPTYTYVHDADVQIIYMAQFWNGQKVREHEKLDGLWEAGIRNYPVCGNFGDYFSETIDGAMSQYNYNDILEYLISQIRLFKPQVVVTHDVNGEYGHGFHMLTSKAVTEAVEKAADNTVHESSIATYGVWDTPKTYIHCYKENAIKLDLRVPIEEDYAGRTALDIAIEAYKKHVSQQWCWFYVSDEYQYSCADFGLYRSLVGNDTTNDIMCNLKTYKVQAAEEESRRIEQESIEQASREAESLEQASIEQASREAESLEQASIEQANSEKQKKEQLEKEENEKQQRLTLIIVAIAIVAIVIGLIIVIIKTRKKGAN